MHHCNKHTNMRYVKHNQHMSNSSFKENYEVLGFENNSVLNVFMVKRHKIKGKKIIIFRKDQIFLYSSC